jgi:plasmid stabilization system protein ParE
MGRYILSETAAEDLRQIIAYIRARDARAAKRVNGEFRATMRRLADLPGIGHTRADVNDDSLLFWRLYSYLIVYRRDTDPLEIVHVVHGARDIGRLLGPS